LSSRMTGGNPPLVTPQSPTTRDQEGGR
jgi:hypothetical protein